MWYAARILPHAMRTLGFLLLSAVPVPGMAPAHAQERQPITRETIERWMVELSNRGRWGDDDQLGTLNLITPERRREGAALVRSGVSVSLSHDYIKEHAPDVSAAGGSPFRHEMIGVAPGGRVAADRFDIEYHGFAHTHLDALCHLAYEGAMYNGVSRAEVTAEGCGRLGVSVAKDGIVARGVLVDIPLLRGVPYLEPGTPIYSEDLEAWEQFAGITIRSGDVLLIRAGRWARREAVGPWNLADGAAGLDPSVAPWLHKRGIAVLGSDYGNDRQPSGIPGWSMPLHWLTIVAMGMMLFDHLDLEAVSEVAAEQRRWEFLFVAAPLAVAGATGSPINPVAIF